MPALLYARAPPTNVDPEAIKTVRISSIIGGVVGGVAAIVVGFLVWYWIRRKHPKTPTANDASNTASQTTRAATNEDAPPQYSDDRKNVLAGQDVKDGGAASELAATKARIPEMEQPGPREVDGRGNEIYEMHAEAVELPAGNEAVEKMADEKREKKKKGESGKDGEKSLEKI